ncbi:hypothetical protein PILCRDRAFT_262864 [Piloderma croceum F 1598]|uniref:Uncharacterized protein n=1 Tax=Piloderma croceum (strain F 1598) TaxID=765440 RepID=A0A0C3BMX5_PILCF|nr:hypothetical protein PILCRDRAFT_262864 [Piloderma croceum F 1598]
MPESGLQTVLFLIKHAYYHKLNGILFQAILTTTSRTFGTFCRHRTVDMQSLGTCSPLVCIKSQVFISYPPPIYHKLTCPRTNVTVCRGFSAKLALARSPTSFQGR